MYVSRHLLLLVLLALPLPLLGQTTDTERAAARDIVRQIDELQARLAPTDMGQDLASRSDAARDAVVSRATELWTSEMQSLSDFIGHNPGVGWEEYLAVDTLTAVLRGRGWDVQVGAAGLETAFVATWTSPAGPEGLMLGLIGEYDALRDADGPFHGDQHNAQTPIVFASAFAMAEHMAAEGMPGRIRIYG
ncbi:MAG: hypothetical protein HOE14_07300, partial [Gemmatimonadales bacterium]|nr:hypothetical protein [Gemmatimonadales bacterium]